MSRALRADPDNPEIHSNLGGAERARGNVEAAEASYRMPIALRPDFAQAHFNLANTLRDRSQNEEAVACYRRAIAIDPSHGGAHLNLGHIHEARGETDSALQCFRQAVTAEPDHVESRKSLAATLVKAGKIEGALTHYQAVRLLAPRDARSLSRMAMALLDVDRRDEAMVAFRAAVDIDPDSADARLNMGNALCAQGQIDEAIATFQTVLERAPDNAAAHKNLGNAMFLSGKTVDALIHLEKALARDPSHLDARMERGMVRLLIGEFEGGWKDYLVRPTTREAASLYYREPLAHDLSGIRLRVAKDQGLGDEIFFLRFAAGLMARGATVEYLCDPRLSAMIERSGVVERVIGANEAPSVNGATLVGGRPALPSRHGERRRNSLLHPARAGWPPRRLRLCQQHQRPSSPCAGKGLPCPGRTFARIPLDGGRRRITLVSWHDGISPSRGRRLGYGVGHNRPRSPKRIPRIATIGQHHASSGTNTSAKEPR